MLKRLGCPPWPSSTEGSVTATDPSGCDSSRSSTRVDCPTAPLTEGSISNCTPGVDGLLDNPPAADLGVVGAGRGGHPTSSSGRPLSDASPRFARGVPTFAWGVPTFACGVPALPLGDRPSFTTLGRVPPVEVILRTSRPPPKLAISVDSWSEEGDAAESLGMDAERPRGGQPTSSAGNSFASCAHVAGVAGISLEERGGGQPAGQ